MSYTVKIKPNGDIDQIVRDDGYLVMWADADFQAWNAAQPIPAQLSAVQQQIQQAKALSFAQFQNLSQAQKDRITYELLQRVLRNEIV